MNDEEKKCEEYLNGWKRALADYDNLKKELSKERMLSREAGKEESALLAIETLDDLDKALQQQPDCSDQAIASWIKGIQHIQGHLEGALEQKGFFRILIEPGQLFDPNLHHAVDQRSKKGVVSGAILQVLQDGWKTHNRVIRPTMVIVNK